MSRAECVWPLAAQLGEGPIWSAAEGAVWFVDIKSSRIHRIEPASGRNRSWDAPESVGFIAPVSDGGFVCGLKSGLHRFDPRSGGFRLLAAVEPSEPDNRLNDGFVDAEGRLWFGSMHDLETDPTGALYRLDDGPRLSRLDDGYVVTNGPAMSPDGRTLYHADSGGQVVYAFDVAADGALSDKRVFARMEHGGVFPDGMAVDQEGCLWIALWGGWGVERHAPDGKVIGRIDLPCAHVTKPAFGGEDLTTLYITTAWAGLSPEDRAAQPLAGGLFRAEAPVAGLPQHEIRHGF